MSELKPCPFCGGEAWQFIPSDVRMINKGCFVECKRCGVRTSCGYPNGDTVDFSLLVWNTRALTPKQQCADEMYELLETIENDDGKIPEWLWDMMQQVKAKARGEI